MSHSHFPSHTEHTFQGHALVDNMMPTLTTTSCNITQGQLDPHSCGMYQTFNYVQGQSHHRTSEKYSMTSVA